MPTVLMKLVPPALEGPDSLLTRTNLRQDNSTKSVLMVVSVKLLRFGSQIGDAYTLKCGPPQRLYPLSRVFDILHGPRYRREELSVIQGRGLY